MKRLIAIALVLVATVGSAFAAEETPNQSIVQLRTPAEVGGEAYCSGFVIDKQRQYVLTADHCMGSPFPVIVDSAPAREIFHDQEQDLAVLFAPGLNLDRDALVFAEDVNYNEPITANGYVRDRYFSISGLVVFKEIVIMEPNQQYGPYILMKPSPIGGMSGGPILNAKGQVVSIVQMGNDIVDMSISTPLRLIREALKDYLGA